MLVDLLAGCVLIIRNMKTTIDLPETLLADARAAAERRGWTVRVVFEESLREFLQKDETAKQAGTFRLSHTIVGGDVAPALSFSEMLEMTNPGRLPE